MRPLIIFLCLLSVIAHTRADSYLIRNADVYTAEGVRSATDIMVNNGKIVAVGKSLNSPSGTTIIEAKGKSVTPGLFNASTRLGVTEVGAIAETNDYSSSNTRFTAALKVAEAVNPASTLIPQNRMHGLTHALVMPINTGAIFSGQAALIHLGTGGKTVVNDSVAVVVELGEAGAEHAGGSRATALAMLREALDDTLDYKHNKAAVMQGNRRSYALSLHDLEALLPVVDGEKPLIVKVHRASDIEAVLALGERYGLTLILYGASEGWMVADKLAANDVAVIMCPTQNLPRSYESLGARLDNAALLHAAGVSVLFMSTSYDQTHNAYLVRQSAGNAAANGMDKSAAIAAMTSNPARVFGMASAGDISVGSEANLVVWGGDPLELISEAELVLIKGEMVPLVSRSTQLRDRYFQKLQEP